MIAFSLICIITFIICLTIRANEDCNLGSYLAPVIASFEIDELISSVKTESDDWLQLQNTFKTSFISRLTHFFIFIFKNV